MPLSLMGDIKGQNYMCDKHMVTIMGHPALCAHRQLLPSWLPHDSLRPDHQDPSQVPSELTSFPSLTCTSSLL